MEILFVKDFIYLFLERGREGQREGEKHQSVVASHTPPTRDVAYNSGMCPDWESNWRPFGLQVSTEPHQPGHKMEILILTTSNFIWPFKFCSVRKVTALSGQTDVWAMSVWTPN